MTASSVIIKHFAKRRLTTSSHFRVFSVNLWHAHHQHSHQHHCHHRQLYHQRCNILISLKSNSRIFCVFNNFVLIDINITTSTLNPGFAVGSTRQVVLSLEREIRHPHCRLHTGQIRLYFKFLILYFHLIS